MIIDNFLVLVMEHSSFEGNRGDSCAETARYAHLQMLLGNYDVLSQVNLRTFITPLGYIRHPEVPEDWKEKDFSEDQGKPLYQAFKRAEMPEASEMKKHIGNRMGNGNLITPGFWGILHDSSFIIGTSVLVQSLIFKLPYRWSDSKKWFEKSEVSSADYLNHVHMAVYAPRWIRRLVNKETIKAKIRDYYSIEPNSRFVIDAYDQVLEKYWKHVGE